jgi:hypothetical protein
MAAMEVICGQLSTFWAVAFYYSLYLYVVSMARTKATAKARARRHYSQSRPLLRSCLCSCSCTFIPGQFLSLSLSLHFERLPRMDFYRARLGRPVEFPSDRLHRLAREARDAAASPAASVRSRIAARVAERATEVPESYVLPGYFRPNYTAPVTRRLPPRPRREK